jgi:AraC-like DNA-binding protein
MRLEPVSPLSLNACDGFLPARTRHAPGESLPRHQHRWPFAAIVLSGSYSECGDTGRHRVSAGDVIFHRQFESHLDRFGSSRAEVFNIPLPSRLRTPTLARFDDPDTIVRTAEKDVSEAVFLLTNQLVEHSSVPEDWPDLLAQRLISSPSASLDELSREFGIHPGSLARGFRRQFGVTPAEFRLIARTRNALESIDRMPLGELAAEAGFADQAHMSRAIKKFTGLTPRELRQELAAVRPAMAPATVAAA